MSNENFVPVVIAEHQNKPITLYHDTLFVSENHERSIILINCNKFELKNAFTYDLNSEWVDDFPGVEQIEEFRAVRFELLGRRNMALFAGSPTNRHMLVSDELDWRPKKYKSYYGERSERALSSIAAMFMTWQERGDQTDRVITVNDLVSLGTTVPYTLKHYQKEMPARRFIPADGAWTAEMMRTRYSCRL
ncbi:MAG: hypothetical protein PHW63_01655 [Alphaproteobacteria bacterium]|nr:hypothetical protein [Alphaproteobacteria bacterium]